METEGSFPRSQEPPTGPYPEARWIQFTFPNSISLRYILILTSHLHTGHPSGLVASGFSTKILYAFLGSRMRATWPIHLTLINNDGILQLKIKISGYQRVSLLLWTPSVGEDTVQM